MAIRIGYSLIELLSGGPVEYTWTTLQLPWIVTYPGGTVSLDRVGLEVPDSVAPTHRLVERWQNQDAAPDGYRFSGVWENPVYDDVNDRIMVDAEVEAIPGPSQEEQDQIAYQNAVNEAVLISASKLVVDNTIPEAQRAKLMVIYPQWEEGKAVVVGDLRRFEGALYRCIQAHTTQSDWTPPAVPALWGVTVAPGTIGPWIQPTGAHDAYPLGAIVTHAGQTWCSSREANVWEPGTSDSGWWVYTV